MITLVALSLWTLSSRIEIQRMKELDDHEVAVRAFIALAPSEAAHFRQRWDLCVPRESQTLGKDFPADLRPLMFTEKEKRDLDACSPHDCAFNFSSSELSTLSQIPQGFLRQSFLENAYLKRARFEENISKRPPQITALSQPFNACQSGPDLKRLIDDRPLRNAEFRLGLAHYHKRMRPTTRLTQALRWKEGKRLCMGEALLYSNHYDIDLVALWSLDDDRLTIQMRHRIDLLNSWFRRLNKEKFRKEAETIVERQIKEASECLKK